MYVLCELKKREYLYKINTGIKIDQFLAMRAHRAKLTVKIFAGTILALFHESRTKTDKVQKLQSKRKYIIIVNNNACINRKQIITCLNHHCHHPIINN